MNMQKTTRRWNSLTVLFVVISILAATVFVLGIGALVFPDAGIPFIWMGFPIGPQPAPIPIQ